ncbi:MAG TPA: adenylate/guanylate cyclase domain-containing protein [Polyangiaceae bacterium]|jgi:adenylate cyclase|nr:adenylate/guanylate cyclase domain-containing protein [Polyangiaceae bacterium]
MPTVRGKLVTLVLACVAPAIAAAVLRSCEAERDMLEQVERRVNGSNRRFGLELDEYQENANLALSLVGKSSAFQKALVAHDAAGAERLVKTLADVYQHRIVLASDARGVLVAKANAERGPVSLGPDASPVFADLLAGKPLTGMADVHFADANGYAMVTAIPIRAGDEQVGAVALLTPITASYLEYLEPKLNADLSVRVNEKVVAACADHPAPDLESHSDTATMKDVGGKLFALKTFRPEKLQRAGMEVEITASRDVTELRDEVRKDLYRELGGLAALLVVVLGVALRFASRMGNAVRSISDAAEKVKTGKYVNAPVTRTGDELETLAEEFNAMVQGLKERDQLRDTFGRYVTRQVADHLMKGNQTLGGELVPVTVLFSDIRSFTSISETMEPRALLDFLNEYFTGMVESVMHHHGVVDKFIGDAIMAVFGAPVPDPQDPLRAVKAALEMRERLKKINEVFKERGLPEIRSGIGLHSGQVVAGNMGHAERMEYTVIGDAVNLASRLESMTKELKCDVILSEDLYRQVQEFVNAEPLHKIKVKGRDQEVMVYRLIELRPEAIDTASASAH